MASAATTVQKHMTNINGILRSFDPKLLSGTFQGVGNFLKDISSYMNSLATFPEGDYSITTKSNDVIFKIRLVLTSILEEMDQLRSFRGSAVDALWCLKKELDFMHMDIDTFLKESKLTQYKSAFEEKDIAEAEELLDDDIIKIDDLESVMKPASFKRLKKKLREVQNVRKFLDSEMEPKLKKAGDECEKASRAVIGKLNSSLDELRTAAKEFVKSIEDGKKRAEFRKFMYSIAQMAFILLACHGACGLVSAGVRGFAAFGEAVGTRGLMLAAGVQLNFVAAEGIKSADEDLKAVETLLKDIKQQTSQWESNTKQTITNWNTLMIYFNQLLQCLKTGGDKLKKEELHDMTSHMTDTKKALQKFDEEIDQLEIDIKKAIKS